jgi:uncharacterized RDD family membrane protein YckC
MRYMVWFLVALFVLAIIRGLFKNMDERSFVGLILTMLILGGIVFFFYCVFFDPSILSTELPIQRELPPR